MEYCAGQEDGNDQSDRQGFKVDTTNTSEVSVGVGGGVVLFEVVVGGRALQCSIERDALELYFWLPVGASDARLLKAFGDGQRRIIAIAECKALQSTAITVEQRAKDFELS